jgi:hypothetical protein
MARPQAQWVVSVRQEAVMTGNGFDYDVIVIGSGFGGSVATLRATEKNIWSRSKKYPNPPAPNVMQFHSAGGG